MEPDLSNVTSLIKGFRPFFYETIFTVACPAANFPGNCRMLEWPGRARQQDVVFRA